MQRSELMFHAAWTGVLAVIVLAAPDHAFQPAGWRIPTGLLLSAMTLVSVVPLTVTSSWFQRLVRKSHKVSVDEPEA